MPHERAQDCVAQGGERTRRSRHSLKMRLYDTKRRFQRLFIKRVALMDIDGALVLPSSVARWDNLHRENSKSALRWRQDAPATSSAPVSLRPHEKKQTSIVTRSPARGSIRRTASRQSFTSRPDSKKPTGQFLPRRRPLRRLRTLSRGWCAARSAPPRAHVQRRAPAKALW